MSDETVAEVVCQEHTDEEVKEVIVQMRVASLEELKQLPVIRKANAVPFTIPGTEITVMLAKCDGNTKYRMTVQQMQMLQADDAPDQEKFLKGQNNALIKSCVIDPVLDDEAIEAINAFHADALEALIEKCVEVSDKDKLQGTDVLESFASGSQPTTS